MQDITKLQTNNWQHKRDTIGGIAVETEDINQCINTICTTRKGKVPYMPELGTNAIEAIGENSDDAIDMISAMWKKEIPMQEPRCEITDITGVKNVNGEIKMSVYYKIKRTGITSKTEIYLNE